MSATLASGSAGALVGAASTIARAIAALYGAASDLNGFLDRHIAELQGSANETIATTGRILEMAKFGFGLGYLSSVVVIAAGQLLLGNTFSAITTVATAATLSNPIAMTCGAVGAVVYGWGALGAAERNALLDQLASGLEVGVELIRSIVAFVVDKARALLSSEALKQFKQFIADKAALFGHTLSDVTHSAVDAMADGVAAARRQAHQAVSATVKAAEEASEAIGEKLALVGQMASQTIDQSSATARSLLGRPPASGDNGGGAVVPDERMSEDEERPR